MHIWIPKKIIEPRDPIGSVIRVAGRWKLEAVRPGRYVRPLAEFPNLITDAGLNRMGANRDYLNRCVVGNGNTPPQTTDTQLASLVASTTSTWQSNANTIAESAPYFGARITYFEFAESPTNRNLAEIGVGWSDTGLFSRALIVDTEGNPTTIAILEGEKLRATYELRLYAPDADAEDTIPVQVDGSPVATDIVVRPAIVTTISAWAFNTSSTPPQGGVSTSQSATDQARIYNGSLGSVTGSPSGNLISIGSSQVSVSSYTPGSFQRDSTISFSTSQGNISGGLITAVRVPFGSGDTSRSGFGCFQVSFSPGIPKDNQRSAAINIRHSWARYNP